MVVVVVIFVVVVMAEVPEAEPQGAWVTNMCVHISPHPHPK